MDPLGYLLLQMAALLANQELGKRIKESIVEHQQQNDKSAVTIQEVLVIVMPPVKNICTYSNF